ncbi:MAG TPA: prolipoprotein diacylglyceryl transferase [Polyangia bacterium]
MLPDLCHIAGGSVHTYGVLIAVGFLAGIVLATRQARREGLNADRVLDLGFWLMVSGLLGSRLLYVLTDLGHYVALCRGDGGPRSPGRAAWDCLTPLKLWEGGLTWYGGLIGALLVGAWFLRRRRMSFLRVADVMIPAVPIGHFFGRVGCFAAGCCFGKPAAGALGRPLGPGSLAFHDLWEAGLLPLGATATGPLHPTQLYEAAGELCIFAALLWLRPRKRFDGQLLLVYLFAYTVLRAVVEVFRGDASRRYVLELPTRAFNAAVGLPESALSFLSVSQALSLAVALAAAVMLVVLRRRRRAVTAA